MIYRIALFLLPCVMAAASAPVDGEVPSGYRTALLLGNSDYDGFTLKGVRESLDLLEPALEERGFHVVCRENLTDEEQKRAVDEFAASVPTNGVALVYYIGLGAHLERQGRLYNLLRPAKTPIESAKDYRSRSLRVADMIETLRTKSGARTSLIFLDASWASPIQPETSEVRSGLRGLELPADTLVLLAGGSGQTLPVPTGDAATALAVSLALHLGKLDASVKDACGAVSSDLSEPWFAGASESGLEKGKHHTGHGGGQNGMTWAETYEMIRRFHFDLIARLAKKLESVPEGDGTMLDNTLIVYLSDGAEAHHSRCWEWPFVLLGDAGGRLKTGRYVDYPGYAQLGHRTTASLYTTLLNCAGSKAERFGVADPNLRDLDQTGPLSELLA